MTHAEWRGFALAQCERGLSRASQAATSRRRLYAALMLGVTLLGGCVSPPRATTNTPANAQETQQRWSGRLSLSVQSDPPQAFTAGFELRGEPHAGELSLYTPLGGTAALLRWAPGRATLRTDGPEQAFDSLEALAQQATGTPLPVAALFDWLNGTPTAVAGWQADLSQLPQGRLRARRAEPPPAAELRLVLER